ncbi:MAG: hypothetical protein HW400_634 [Candidatus Levybacteria bacterium]|nr:hypothetical protein [Candidatus Levybacteria bacterium]
MSEDAGKLELISFDNLGEQHNISNEYGVWAFHASRLPGLFGGITTGLRREEDEKINDNLILIDWPDILNRPEVTRINIFPFDRFRERPFDHRFLRTIELVESLQTYDNDLMVESKLKYKKEEIAQMLKIPQLPRPQIALIDADQKDLDIFFNQEGFKQGKDYAGAYRVPWNKFVELAKAGHIPLF